MAYIRILYIIVITLITFTYEQEAIDLLSNGIPDINDPDTIYIPIFHSNDIHGTFYPQEVYHTEEAKRYKSGGLEYMGKYISIMREQWKNRLLWFDSGDQFQGSLESTLSSGEIITDFYNTMKLDYFTIGNHEFDYGQEYLATRLKESTAKLLGDNLSFGEGSNQGIKDKLEKESAIIDIDGIKIGLIGLATIETEFTTSGDLTGIQFEDYYSVVMKKAEELRKKNVNAVVLLAHIGCQSLKDDNVKYDLKVRGINDEQSKEFNEQQELAILMKLLPKGTVDLVIGGHKHTILHHWINETPCSVNQANGETVSIAYLAFDKTTKALQKEKIKLEGPWPICEKVFTLDGAAHCKILDTEQEISNAGEMKRYKFHGVEIAKEESLEPIASKYLSSVKEYENYHLTTINQKLQRSKEKENPLGNLFSDFIQRVTNADISIMNGGFFRKTWPTGAITKRSVWEMSPFNDTVVSVEMTGAEVTRMMYELQEGVKGFYVTAGLKQVVANDGHKSLLSFKVFDGLNENEIDPYKTYTIGSIHFCIPFGGDDFSKVLSWYTPRNFIDYGLLNDHLINWFTGIPQIDVGLLIDPKHPRLRIAEPSP